MRYAYFPGCSLEKTQRSYDASVRAIFAALDQELVEIEDWNCCGATMYMSVAETVSLAVSARNLALAERMGLDILAPCSSCYTILAKTNRILQQIPELFRDVNAALAEGGLTYSGRTRVRHPLDVLMNDIGPAVIRTKLRRELQGLRIAPYYGCQIVRPEKGFDDREDPVLLDRLLQTCGATVTEFPMKVRCCGGMLMATFPDTALALNRDLLQCAIDSGADVVATTCPLCHFNLEGYQGRINRAYGTSFVLPVLYFTQVLGIALGVPPKKLALDASFIPLGHRISTLTESAYA